MHENKTETDDYALIPSENNGKIRYVIVHLPTKGLIYMETDAAYEQEIEKLLKSGARIITIDELKKMDGREDS